MNTNEFTRREELTDDEYLLVRLYRLMCPDDEIRSETMCLAFEPLLREYSVQDHQDSPLFPHQAAQSLVWESIGTRPYWAPDSFGPNLSYERFRSAIPQIAICGIPPDGVREVLDEVLGQERTDHPLVYYLCGVGAERDELFALEVSESFQNYLEETQERREENEWGLLRQLEFLIHDWREKVVERLEKRVSLPERDE